MLTRGRDSTLSESQLFSPRHLIPPLAVQTLLHSAHFGPLLTTRLSIYSALFVGAFVYFHESVATMLFPFSRCASPTQIVLSS